MGSNTVDMKKDRNFRIGIEMIKIMLITLIVLWSFLILSAAIPNEMLKENMLKSAVLMTQTESFSYHEGTKMSGIADNYADSIWLNVAWYMGEGNPVVSSVNTMYYDSGDSVRNGLYYAVTEKEIKANTDYTRYWHGTAGIIRFLHIFTDVKGIKIIGFLSILSLAALLMILLIREKKDSVAVAFFVALCFIKIWNVRLSMEYQPAFFIGLLMCILFLLYEKKGDRYLLFLSVISGTGIAFFDFLTTETVGLLLPMILVITVREMEKRSGSFKKSILGLVQQATAWLGAYAMTIVTKWCLASVFTGSNKFDDAFTKAAERVGGINQGTNELNPILQKMAAPAANLSVLFGGSRRLDKSAIIIGILFLILYVVIFCFCLKYGKKENKTAILILFLLGSVIWVRYLILNNHSYMHAFFTYRGSISMLMAFFSIIILNLSNKAIKQKK